jgi:hypothetical protein
MLRKALELDVDYLVISVHPRAARFYKDGFHFEQIGDECLYPGLTTSAVAVALASPQLATAERELMEILSACIGRERAELERKRPLNAAAGARAEARRALLRARPDVAAAHSSAARERAVEASVA